MKPAVTPKTTTIRATTLSSLIRPFQQCTFLTTNQTSNEFSRHPRSAEVRAFKPRSSLSLLHTEEKNSSEAGSASKNSNGVALGATAKRAGKRKRKGGLQFAGDLGSATVGNEEKKMCVDVDGK